jgi:hypothetical protein
MEEACKCWIDGILRQSIMRAASGSRHVILMKSLCTDTGCGSFLHWRELGKKGVLLIEGHQSRQAASGNTGAESSQRNPN